VRKPTTDQVQRLAREALPADLPGAIPSVFTPAQLTALRNGIANFEDSGLLTALDNGVATPAQVEQALARVIRALALLIRALARP
jgi:hypothetical protein